MLPALLLHAAFAAAVLSLVQVFERFNKAGLPLMP